jgi:peptidoglycan/xylan/chitin deacetylase (PgdA/CDA1 family)
VILDHASTSSARCTGLLRSLATEERQKVLQELSVWSGRGTTDHARTGRPTHRTLSPDEVTCLAEGELIEVGAHTVTHPVLSTLAAAAQEGEIRRSKADLEELLGHSVMSFSYPHGAYTAETAAIVQEAGFTCACACGDDAVWQGTDCFQLPRLGVPDWDGERFARWLRGWQGG